MVHFCGGGGGKKNKTKKQNKNKNKKFGNFYFLTFSMGIEMEH